MIEQLNNWWIRGRVVSKTVIWVIEMWNRGINWRFLQLIRILIESRCAMINFQPERAQMTIFCDKKEVFKRILTRKEIVLPSAVSIECTTSKQKSSVSLEMDGWWRKCLSMHKNSTTRMTRRTCARRAASRRRVLAAPTLFNRKSASDDDFWWRVEVGEREIIAEQHKKFIMHHLFKFFLSTRTKFQQNCWKPRLQSANCALKWCSRQEMPQYWWEMKK